MKNDYLSYRALFQKVYSSRRVGSGVLDKIKARMLKHVISSFASIPILSLQMMPNLVYRGVMLMPIRSFFIRSYDQRYQKDLSFLFRLELFLGSIQCFLIKSL